MIRLLCGENNLEYTGEGYLQCSRHVDCPKKMHNRILGLDCLVYIDNLPAGFKINIPEENVKDDIGIRTDATDAIDAGIDIGRMSKHKKEKPIEISRTIEYITV